MLIRALTAALLTAGAMASAQADGFVTTNETAIDRIYAQTSFGSTPIDIRFLGARSVVAPALVAIDSAAEFNALASFASAAPVVSAFFVDDINFCGTSGNDIVGCGAINGNFLAVDSQAAADPDGLVLAHELGHNLGLSHVAGADTNLMNPELYAGPAPAPLTGTQVSTIFNSPLVQHDAAGYFITVQPYAVLSAVPEPAGALLSGLGLGVVALARRRRGAAAVG